jgi:hypothetical protein
MGSIETKFRSLSRLAAECQRQVERLYHVDSITVQKEVAELIRSSIRTLEQDIEVNLGTKRRTSVLYQVYRWLNNWQKKRTENHRK